MMALLGCGQVHELSCPRSGEGHGAPKSGDITFSCGCLLIFKHYTLRTA